MILHPSKRKRFPQVLPSDPTNWEAGSPASQPFKGTDMFYLRFEGGKVFGSDVCNAVGPFKSSADAHWWWANNDPGDWEGRLEVLLHPDDTVE